jgi:hypothetical protein
MPSGHASDQQILSGCLVTRRFIDMPLFACCSSFSHSLRSDRTSVLSLIVLPLVVLLWLFVFPTVERNAAQEVSRDRHHVRCVVQSPDQLLEILPFDPPT